MEVLAAAAAFLALGFAAGAWIIASNSSRALSDVMRLLADARVASAAPTIPRTGRDVTHRTRGSGPATGRYTVDPGTGPHQLPHQDRDRDE